MRQSDRLSRAIHEAQGYMKDTDRHGDIAYPTRRRLDPPQTSPTNLVHLPQTSPTNLMNQRG